MMFGKFVEQKSRFQQAFRSKFEFVPSLFWFVLKFFVCNVPPDAVLILIDFKFIVPKLWQHVVFCTCRILPKGLTLEEKWPENLKRIFLLVSPTSFLTLPSWIFRPPRHSWRREIHGSWRPKNLSASYKTISAVAVMHLMTLHHSATRCNIQQHTTFFNGTVSRWLFASSGHHFSVFRRTFVGGY